MQNYTTFIPKTQPMGGNSQVNRNSMNQGVAQQQPQDMKKIFINEIRSRIEAYFKLIVRNLRDSIPKTIGMNLVKSIEENMQITLYNMLYKSQEVVNVLNEPESVMIRRKELTEQIKVLRDAQRIIRRDPDLMQVMQIDINDSDISGHGKKEEGSQKTGSSSTVKTSAPVETKAMVPPAKTEPSAAPKPKGFGNLFGTVKK